MRLRSRTIRMAIVPIALVAMGGGACGVLTGIDDYILVADASPDTPNTLRDGDNVVSIDATMNADGNGGVDGGADAMIAPCPSICNGGCGGGTCMINCPACSFPLTCPPGLSCDVRCTGSGCENATIDCSASNACRVSCTGLNTCRSARFFCGAGPCRIHCEDKDACDRLTLDASTAQSLCLECVGYQSCDDLVCNVPSTCTTACGTSSCVNLGVCNNCVDASACP